MEDKHYEALRDELDALTRHVVQLKWLAGAVLAILVLQLLGPKATGVAFLWIIPVALMIGFAVYLGFLFFEKLVALKHGTNWSAERLQAEIEAFQEKEERRQKAEDELDDGKDK